MKKLLLKFFSWIRDHFSCLFVVIFRLHVGKDKKQNPLQNEVSEADTREEPNDG